MEQLEKQDKTVRKLKKQLKVLTKKFGEREGIFVFWGKEKGFCLLFVIPTVTVSTCFSSWEVFSSLCEVIVEPGGTLRAQFVPL